MKLFFSRQLLYVCLSLLLILTTFGYYEYLQPSLLQPQLLAEQPDYWAENVYVKQFNFNGKLAHELKSSKVVHFAAQDKMLLDKPDMIFFEQKQPNSFWHIQSNKGELFHRENRVELMEHVLIKQHLAPNQNNQIPMNVTTEALTIFPKNKTAENHLPVTLSRQDMVLQSVGMKANFALGTLNLLSKSQAHYEI